MIDDGFVPDATENYDGFIPDAPTSDNNYWSDVRKNAVSGAKEIIPGAVNTAKTIFKAGQGVTVPGLVQSHVQALSGVPWSETPTGQSAEAMKEIALGVPKGIFQAFSDTVKVPFSVGELAFGTPPKQTMFAKTFRERPISSVFNVATVAYPLGKRLFSPNVPTSAIVPKAAIPAEAAVESPNLLQIKGTQGLNQSAGIRGATLNRLTPSGRNPAVTGIDLMRRMKDEGALGGSLPETFDNVNRLINDYGGRVKTVTQKIIKADKELRGKNLYGGGSNLSGFDVDPYTGLEIESPLKVQSVPVLKPIIDEANALLKSGYDDAVGAKMKRMYQNLQEAANENNGFLTFKHVDDEMGHVGKLFEHAARDSDKFKMASTLYGKLAEIRDTMVDDVASRVPDQMLRDEFLAANKGYSTYKRIMPDIRKAVSMEITGQPTFGGITEQIKDAIAGNKKVSGSVLGAGDLLKNLSKENALVYLKRAGGNKDLARQLAIRELQGMNQPSEKGKK